MLDQSESPLFAVRSFGGDFLLEQIVDGCARDFRGLCRQAARFSDERRVALRLRCPCLLPRDAVSCFDRWRNLREVTAGTCAQHSSEEYARGLSVLTSALVKLPPGRLTTLVLTSLIYLDAPTIAQIIARQEATLSQLALNGVDFYMGGSTLVVRAALNSPLKRLVLNLRPPPDPRGVAELVLRAKATLKHLSLAGFAEGGVLEFPWEHCTSVDVLEIDQYQPRQGELAYISQRLPGLQRLTLKLTELTWSRYRAAALDLLQQELQKFKSLEELSVDFDCVSLRLVEAVAGAATRLSNLKRFSAGVPIKGPGGGDTARMNVVRGYKEMEILRRLVEQGYRWPRPVCLELASYKRGGGERLALKLDFPEAAAEGVEHVRELVEKTWSDPWSSGSVLPETDR